MNTWPVRLSGILGPARGKLDQYEFWCHGRQAIKSLPLTPYAVTVSPVKGGHNPGMPITCQFNTHTVRGQFHRKRENQGIWIGSNFTENHDATATKDWHDFMSWFEIRVGVDNKKVLVYLDFYADPSIIIGLR